MSKREINYTIYNDDENVYENRFYNLPDEIILLMITFMRFKAMFGFLTTCKKMNTFLQEDSMKTMLKHRYISYRLRIAIENLKRSLFKFPNNMGSNIMNLLKNENAILAGDYVLQFLSKTVFENTDIDIYIPCYPNQIDFQKIMIDKIKLYFNIDDKNSPCYIEKLLYNMSHRLYDNIFVKVKIPFFTRNINLMFIICKEDVSKCGSTVKNVEEYVFKYFDLSFLKCTFNGYIIKSKGLLKSEKKCGTFDFDNISILKRNIKRINIDQASKDSIFRCEKKILMIERKRRIEMYKKKGFKIFRKKLLE